METDRFSSPHDGGAEARDAEQTHRCVLRDGVTGEWLHFETPCRTVTATEHREVLPALLEIEDAVERGGLHAAGFIAYEAAPAFDPALRTHPAGGFPLLWFGLYRARRGSADLPPGTSALLAGWERSVTEGEYRRAFREIRERIRAGDTYQVNYTHRLTTAAGDASPWSLFVDLARSQDPPYGAFVDAGRWVLCSASPELFFRLDGSAIESQPMKGTAPRGLTRAGDLRRAAALRRSPKNRAENAMIVDMVRNDLGRIADVGSVAVAERFALRRHPTVWQLVSTVRGKTGVPVHRIIAALFPSASVTGAPKVRTMEIIAQLESTPRRVYTGAIGFMSPGRVAQFNVAIRTVIIDREQGAAEYGVGGGIVWDSRWAREWEECRVKARALTQRRPEFDLVETILWSPEGGYALLDDHLRRLLASARHFGFTVDAGKVRRELRLVASGFPRTRHRVRLLVGPRGGVGLSARPLGPGSGFGTLTPSARSVDADDIFLYHKTTHRQVYDTAKATRPGVDDVILFNHRGEATESTIANVVVASDDGGLVTPPVRCGLLAGTARADLLRRGVVREQVVTLEELLDGRDVYLVNAVRGMQRVELTRPG